MIAFQETLDFSTYKLDSIDVWSGADETRSIERQERADLRLLNKLAGVNAFYLRVVGAPTLADYSVFGRVTGHRNDHTAFSGATSPAPLPFLKAYYEMDSFKALDDGWDGVGSERASEDSVNAALTFLALLPSDVPSPEASAANDGTVDWYWRKGGFAATITFFKNKKVAYFARTDVGSVKDSFKFNDSIPGELVESLRRL